MKVIERVERMKLQRMAKLALCLTVTGAFTFCLSDFFILCILYCAIFDGNTTQVLPVRCQRIDCKLYWRL